MNPLQGKRIVLGVTGGVAAYKAAELTRLLVKAGAAVDVVLTEAGSRFVGAATFQALSGHPVFTSLWDERFANGMAHIDLTRGADAILVAPATADFLAKLAHGFAGDLLATLCLARDCPLLVAPAMNRQMWENPATARNVAQVAADGIAILGPAEGEQACGETGAGRMLEPAELLDALVAFFQPKPLAGRRVLLTVGPTFEALDPVRGLTNASSGRMGFALARACAEAGAAVTAVCGPVSLPTPAGVARIDVQGARDMRAAVLANLNALPVDIFIAVAAVADYRPAAPEEHKIKKGAERLTLELVANPDILAEVAARPDAPFCVGFAAESRDLEKYAEGKRQAKRLPLVVGNLVQDGLGGEANVVTLFDAAGAHPLPPGDKLTIARAIVRHIAEMKKDA
ncbi:MAG: bifunctional phosphopantothenoylcysteine decarboxylase/phosphopantothenate--cysteine ligase CoaBC [Pseudomonadota bacterium]